MIGEKTLNLLKRNAQKEIEKNVSANDGNSIEFYINDISEILGIDVPIIQSVACLYEHQGLIQAQEEFRRNEIPEQAQFYGAYYLDDENKIILPRKCVVTDFNTGAIHFKNHTKAEHLFILTHELRHVWQKKFHEEKYYKHNAVGMENINDIAELDADAFAIAYLFSAKTPFTSDDLPSEIEEICLQAMADNGKRWERAEKLSADYGFGNSEKILVTKNSVDQDKLKRVIAFMKLNTMI